MFYEGSKVPCGTLHIVTREEDRRWQHHIGHVHNFTWCGGGWGEGGVVPCHLDNNDNNDPSPQTMASLHPGLMTAVWRRPGRPSLQILIRAPQSPGRCWPLSPGSRPGPAFLRMHGIAASAWPPSTPPLPSTLHSADQRESTLEAVTVIVILIT